MAYLGQLRRRLPGVRHSDAADRTPRATATLVDSAAARFLRRYAVDLEALQPQDESALNRLLESQLPPSVEQAMREAGDAVQRSMTRVAEALPELDPTLAGAAQTTLGTMEHDLRRSTRRSSRPRSAATRRSAASSPACRPRSSRSATRRNGRSRVVYFLNQYGPHLVDRLIDELPLEMGQHWVITI